MFGNFPDEIPVPYIFLPARADQRSFDSLLEIACMNSEITSSGESAPRYEFFAPLLPHPKKDRQTAKMSKLAIHFLTILPIHFLHLCFEFFIRKLAIHHAISFIIIQAAIR